MYVVILCQRIYTYCEDADIECLKHGITRTSGERPVTDQDRRRELQKINEYKGLVTLIQRKVRISFAESYFLSLVEV